MPENIYKQDNAMEKNPGDILHNMIADNRNYVSSYLKLSEQNRLDAVSVLDGIAPIMIFCMSATDFLICSVILAER